MEDWTPNSVPALTVFVVPSSEGADEAAVLFPNRLVVPPVVAVFPKRDVPVEEVAVFPKEKVISE